MFSYKENHLSRNLPHFYPKEAIQMLGYFKQMASWKGSGLWARKSSLWCSISSMCNPNLLVQSRENSGLEITATLHSSLSMACPL